MDQTDRCDKPHCSHKKSHGDSQTNTKTKRPIKRIVERPHQHFDSMVRTMKEVIDDATHVKLSADESVTTWMIRHRAFFQTLFAVGSDGKAPFSRQRHKDYTNQFHQTEQQLQQQCEMKKLERYVCSVKTTPQKTRSRDVKYARIWDTD